MIFPQFDPDKEYLVAVSGGPDSMALLDMMFKQGLKISVAHVNYHLRESSLRDERIVRQYCSDRNIPLHIHSVEAKVVGNLQSWARKIRYDFFQKVAAQKGSRVVVVAHHLNDVIESYVMQKSRNVMTDHYGIPANTQIGDLTVIRPLLSYRKDELLQYCEEKSIEFGIDETNLKAVYTRNKYRIQLSRMTDTELSLLLTQLQHDNQHLDDVVRSTIEFEKAAGIQGRFAVEAFTALDSETKMKVIDRFLLKQTGQKHHFRYALLVKIIDWLQSCDSGKDFATRSWKLTVIDGSLQLMHLGSDEILVNDRSKFPLHLNEFVVSLNPSDNDVSYISFMESDFPLRFCCPAPVGSKLMIKGRLRSVRKVLADHKVPAALRSSYYSVFSSSGNCIGIVGILTHQGVLNRKNMLFVLK